jgi:hypothetical protein
VTDASYSNNASGNARVDAQIGHVGTYVRSENGTVHFGARIYESRTDSPEELFTIGCRYLAAGAAQRAVELITEAVARGFRAPQVAYYWAVAVLAGKPFDQVKRADFETFEKALEMADGYTVGPWRGAVHVVAGLLDCYISERAADHEFDQDTFADVMSRFDRLPEDRKEEIGRHLALLLGGAVQNRLDAERREQIKRHRLARDRRRRVPLFFEADPEPPRLRRPEPSVVSSSHRIALVLGVLLVVVGAAIMLIGVFHSGVLHGLILSALWASAFFGAVTLGPELVYLLWLRRRALSIDATAALEDQLIDPIPGLADLLDGRLDDVAPDDPVAMRDFDRAVAGERLRLLTVLNGLYGSESGKPVSALQLDWLVRWHVRHLVRAWRAGELRRPPPAGDLPAGATAASALASLGIIAGFLLGAAYLLRWNAVLAIPVAALSGALLVVGARLLLLGAT